MKILIIDDNKDKADVIADFLIGKFGSGTMVNVTGSINSGKTELDEGNYDVAIIDNSLPDDENGSINTIGVPAEILVSHIQRNYLDTKAIIMSDENDKDDQFLQAAKVSYSVCKGVVRFKSDDWKNELVKYITTDDD